MLDGVMQNLGATIRNALTAGSESHEKEAVRVLHPGANTDGRRFKLVEVTGVLGST